MKRPKLLFVNPYITDFTAFDLWLRPLGLLYLAAIVKRYTDAQVYWFDLLDRAAFQTDYKFGEDGRGKYDRQIIPKPELYRMVPRNYARYGMPLDRLEKKIKELPSDIDAVFVTSLMTYWVDGINETILNLRKHLKQATFFLGGVIPSLIPEEVQNWVDADCFIGGAAEKKIVEIAKDFGAAIKPGFDKMDSIHHYPLPAFELLKSKRVLPLITSRGCPQRCSYCASHLINRSFVERDSDSVIQEILYHCKTYGTEHFTIFDDAFLINKKKRFVKIFSKLSEKFKLSFHTPNGIHAREIDKETAILLKQCGFKTVRLSFESTDPEILKRSSQKVNISEMKGAVDNLISAGFKAGELEAYLLFGLHEQSADTLFRSLDFVEGLQLVPRLSVYSPVPGTPDFIKLQRQGVLHKPVNLYETNKTYFLYHKSGLSNDQIVGVKKRSQEITTRLKQG